MTCQLCGRQAIDRRGHDGHLPADLRIERLHREASVCRQEYPHVVIVGGTADNCHHLRVLLENLQHLPGGVRGAVSEEAHQQRNVVHLVQMRPDVL